MCEPPPDTRTEALLLVDIQPDFMPAGALPVPAGDEILGPVGRLMQSGRFAVQVATQDWHPPDHVSFASQHDGRDPLTTMDYYGHTQMLWPDHCVQQTPGARLHPDLPWEYVRAVIRKGMESDADSYSGFRNNWDPRGERPVTGLAGYLNELGVKSVYVCGLARDVCALWTALDAVEFGFHTFFIWDMTRAVDPESDDDTESQLSEKKVKFVSADQMVGT